MWKAWRYLSAPERPCNTRAFHAGTAACSCSGIPEIYIHLSARSVCITNPDKIIRNTTPALPPRRGYRCSRTGRHARRYLFAPRGCLIRQCALPANPSPGSHEKGEMGVPSLSPTGRAVSWFVDVACRLPNLHTHRALRCMYMWNERQPGVGSKRPLPRRAGPGGGNCFVVCRPCLPFT